MLVAEVGHLVLQVAHAVEELGEAVVKRGAADRGATVVNLHGDFSAFNHERHDAVLTHEERCQARAVHRSGKVETAMHDVARVNVFQVVIVVNLEIQHAPVEHLHVRRALDVVAVGA